MFTFISVLWLQIYFTLGITNTPDKSLLVLVVARLTGVNSVLH